MALGWPLTSAALNVRSFVTISLLNVVPSTTCHHDIASTLTQELGGAQIGGQGWVSNGLDAMNFTKAMSQRRHRNVQARQSWIAHLWLTFLVRWRLIRNCLGDSCLEWLAVGLVAANQLDPSRFCVSVVSMRPNALSLTCCNFKGAGYKLYSNFRV